MKAVRRWLIYRRLMNELVNVPEGALAELSTPRKALRDFAWHWAGIEVNRVNVPLAHHQLPQTVISADAQPPDSSCDPRHCEKLRPPAGAAGGRGDQDRRFNWTVR